MVYTKDSKRKKVMFVLPHLRTGGGQKLVIDIIGNLDSERLDVLLVSLYPAEGNIFEDLAEEKGIQIKYLQKKEGINLSVIKELISLIKNVRPDVIHAHLRVMPYLLFPLIVTDVKKRYYTVHNLAEKDAGNRRYMKMILNFAFRYAKVVPIAISDLCKQSIVSFYNLPKEQVPCIYNGIDANRFKCIIPYTQRKSETLTFIATGRMEPQKNYKLMLEAFSEVYKTYSNIRLVILGDGYLRKELEEDIKRLNISNSVLLKGRVSNVEKELNNAHVYLMSSNWEGLPLSVMEAMSCGLPIISTKAGGVIDIIKHNKNGCLINIGDKEKLIEAMLKMVTEPDLRNQFSISALESSKMFDIKECANKHMELYLTEEKLAIK
ncbi:glycosyltransferase [Priestia sp. D3YE.R1]|uniref:glycosyltransferase n=1 Tax=Priestia sp. D3YE.R1 TaxID=3400416 RepID=UPI003B9E2CCB